MLEVLVCAKDWLFKAKVPKSYSDSEGCSDSEEVSVEG